MKKVLLAIVAVLSLTACIPERSVFVKEPHAEKQVSAKGFVAIDVAGSPTVRYQQADSTSVEVTGPESQVENITVRVENGRLKIGSKNDKSLLRMNSVDKVVVYVTSPDLIGVTLSGSGDFICETPLDTDTLKLLLRGSGDIDFASVLCDCLNAEVVGSGDVDVKQAQTQMASLRLTGSGDLDVRLKNTAQTSISLLGSGDIDVDFDNCRLVDCQLRGSGDIELSGQIEHLTKQKSGSGSIDKGKLTIKK